MQKLEKILSTITSSSNRHLKSHATMTLIDQINEYTDHIPFILSRIYSLLTSENGDNRKNGSKVLSAISRFFNLKLPTSKEVDFNEVKLNDDKLNDDKINDDKLNDDKLNDDKLNDDKLNDDKINDDKLNDDKLNDDKLNDDKLNDDKLNEDKLNVDKLNEVKLNQVKKNQSNDSKFISKIKGDNYYFATDASEYVNDFESLDSQMKQIQMKIGVENKLSGTELFTKNDIEEGCVGPERNDCLDEQRRLSRKRHENKRLKLISKVRVQKQDPEVRNINDFFANLEINMLSPYWYKRHGSFLAYCGLFSGGQLGAANSSFKGNKSKDLHSGNPTKTNSALKATEYTVTLPKSLLKNTFEILYRDKFSDFISDQSTAPVREAAAFLLKSIYPHLDTATQNQAVESTFAFLRSADWQVIVSGLLCTDQLIAFLTPAQKQQLSRTLAPLINAPDEDVRYWAAKILTRLSPQMDGPLAIEAARRCWNDIKNSDDISLSKTSVVLLLAEVYQQHKHLFKIRGKDDLSIEKNLFLLFPCFRSPIRDVRKSILHLFISIFQNFKNGDKHGREVKNDKSYYKEDKKEVINDMNDCKDGHINNDMNNDKDGYINDDMNNDKDGHINNDIKNDKDGHINNDMNNHINNDNNNVNTQHTCLPIPKIFSYLIQNLFVEEKEDILELTKRLLTLTYPHLKNKKENIRRYIKILTKNLNDEYTKSEFEDSTLETDLHFSNSGIKALGEEVIMRGRVMFLEFLTDVAEGSDIEIHDIEFEAVKRITESYFLELCKSIKNLKSNKNYDEDKNYLKPDNYDKDQNYLKDDKDENYDKVDNYLKDDKDENYDKDDNYLIIDNYDKDNQNNIICRTLIDDVIRNKPKLDNFDLSLISANMLSDVDDDPENPSFNKNNPINTSSFQEFKQININEFRKMISSPTTRSSHQKTTLFFTELVRYRASSSLALKKPNPELFLFFALEYSRSLVRFVSRLAISTYSPGQLRPLLFFLIKTMPKSVSLFFEEFGDRLFSFDDVFGYTKVMRNRLMFYSSVVFCFKDRERISFIFYDCLEVMFGVSDKERNNCGVGMNQINSNKVVMNQINSNKVVMNQINSDKMIKNQLNSDKMIKNQINSNNEFKSNQFKNNENNNQFNNNNLIFCRNILKFFVTELKFNQIVVEKILEKLNFYIQENYKERTTHDLKGEDIQKVNHRENFNIEKILLYLDFILDIHDHSFNVLFVRPLLKIIKISGNKTSMAVLSKIISTLQLKLSDQVVQVYDSYNSQESRSTRGGLSRYGTSKGLSLIRRIFYERSIIEQLFDPEKLEKMEIAPLKVKLRDYQVKGIEWINFLRVFGVNGILADDMGLGKTVQVLGYLESVYKRYIEGRHIGESLCTGDYDYKTNSDIKQINNDIYEKQINNDIYEKQTNNDIYEKQNNNDIYEKQTNNDIYEKQNNNDIYDYKTNSDIKQINNDIYEKQNNNDIYEKQINNDIYEKQINNNDYHSFTCLVICPSSLIDHWVNEIEKTTFSITGVAYRRGKYQRLEDMFNENSSDQKMKIIITSYESLRSDYELFLAKTFFYMIIDEGHILRNRATLVYKRLSMIKARNKIILTGTPIQNSVDDLYSLFNFLMPGYLGDEGYFGSYYLRAINQGREKSASENDVKKMDCRIKELHRKVLPFILRRLKSDVLMDLPEKVIKDVLVEMTAKQRLLYDAVSGNEFKDGKNDMSRILQGDKFDDETEELKGSKEDNDELKGIKKEKAHIKGIKNGIKEIKNDIKGIKNGIKEIKNDIKGIKNGIKGIKNGINEIKEDKDEIKNSTDLSYGNLRRSGFKRISEQLKICSLTEDAANSCKISALNDLIRIFGAEEMDNKVLIFCQFKTSITAIKAYLEQNYGKLGILVLDGTVPPRKRQGVVDQFYKSKYQILLLTTSIGGLGLNLTCADTVIFFEHDWNPFNDLQAMDRAHRLGQKSVVNVFRIICKDTVEESVMSLQKFKVFVAGSVVSQQNSNVGSMDLHMMLDNFEEKVKNLKGNVEGGGDHLKDSYDDEE